LAGLAFINPRLACGHRKVEADRESRSIILGESLHPRRMAPSFTGDPKFIVPNVHPTSSLAVQTSFRRRSPIGRLIENAC
jgi:hypothetical protein